MWDNGCSLAFLRQSFHDVCKSHHAVHLKFIQCCMSAVSQYNWEKKKKNPNPNPGLESESLHHKVNILGNSYSSLARFSKQNKRQTPRKRTENPNPWLNLNFRQTRFFRNKYIPRNLGNISVLRNSSIWSEIRIKLSIFLLPGSPKGHTLKFERQTWGVYASGQNRPKALGFAENFLGDEGWMAFCWSDSA